MGYPTEGLDQRQADSKTSLIVKYIQAGDLGAKYGGNIIDYELRPGMIWRMAGWWGKVFWFGFKSSTGGESGVFDHGALHLTKFVETKHVDSGHAFVLEPYAPLFRDVSRYARKEKYLEDPDAGVLNLEESGGSPDQVGNSTELNRNPTLTADCGVL